MVSSKEQDLQETLKGRAGPKLPDVLGHNSHFGVLFENARALYNFQLKVVLLQSQPIRCLF